MGHHTMNTLLLLAASGLAGVMAQYDKDYGNYPEDDFQCPDELEGYFPHAYSCDKYWACVEGLAELRTCGNGLAFIDTPSGAFTKHAHPLDCRQFFLCIGGIPREQGCPLGEVFDEGTGSGVDGKCTSPDQVPECADYYADNPDVVQQAQISDA